MKKGKGYLYRSAKNIQWNKKNSVALEHLDYVKNGRATAITDWLQRMFNRYLAVMAETA